MSAQVKPQDETKQSMIFVGNLSYQTRETELKKLCEDIGKVSISKIIFRGPRSQGYGFVTFESEDDAQRAVDQLKGKEFDGRTINVERAVPKSERPPREDSRPRRGSFRGRGYRGGYRGGRYDGSSAPRRRSRPTGPPSKTIVFVGNLPFKVTEEHLSKMFSDYKVESTRVVRRPDGLSRGFGFVTLVNEEEQKRAIEELAGAECKIGNDSNGRVLIIRAAHSEEPATADKDEEGEDEE